jgi:hypothetical protein
LLRKLSAKLSILVELANHFNVISLQKGNICLLGAFFENQDDEWVATKSQLDFACCA